MRPRARVFVLAVCTLAILSWALLYRSNPVPLGPSLSDAMLLASLAIAAELLAFVLPRSAAGSMAFIPYFALAFVLPNWVSVFAVTIIRAGFELWVRRDPVKAAFNVSVHALMECAAVVMYVALGGSSLLLITEITHVGHVTRVVGGPALVASGIALTLNNVLVDCAIGFSTGRPVLQVWRENHKANIGVDLLATPLVFVFAWAYAAFGAIVAATLWIPILGLRQLQRTNLELEKANQELLELMVKSLEARDPYTSGHSRRVHHYSVIIARALSLPEREIDQVGRAALLHDVGKIHEKYAAVLAKTDKLTPEEWALIQEHPADGASLAATISHLKDVVPAIRSHHENWDGTGYPDGLAGELIPVAARIIRFADTIDAMTTERPYRRPLTELEVRNEVVRCRGTQFDPGIADALLSSPLWSSLFASPAVSAAAKPRGFVVVPSRKPSAQPRATAG